MPAYFQFIFCISCMLDSVKTGKLYASRSCQIGQMITEYIIWLCPNHSEFLWLHAAKCAASMYMYGSSIFSSRTWQCKAS